MLLLLSTHILAVDKVDFITQLNNNLIGLDNLTAEEKVELVKNMANVLVNEVNQKQVQNLSRELNQQQMVNMFRNINRALIKDVSAERINEVLTNCNKMKNVEKKCNKLYSGLEEAIRDRDRDQDCDSNQDRERDYKNPHKTDHDGDPDRERDQDKDCE